MPALSDCRIVFMGTPAFAYGYVDGNDWKVWLAHKVGKNWVWQSDLHIWTSPPKRINYYKQTK